MTTWGGETSEEPRNDMLLTTSSSGPMRSDTRAPTHELSRSSGATKWSRKPELTARGQMSEFAAIAGYYCSGDLMDGSASERAQPYRVLVGERPSQSRIMRKILNARAPPKEMDSYAVAKDRNYLKGIGDILRPRQESVSLLPEALPRTHLSLPQSFRTRRGLNRIPYAKGLRKSGGIGNDKTRRVQISLIQVCSLCGIFSTL